MLFVSLLSAALAVTPAGGIAALEQLRDQLRSSGTPATISIQKGDYFVTHPIELDARDPAGTIFQFQPGARLIGGARLKAWRPVTDPAILARLTPQARRAVRVHAAPGAGPFQPRGFGRPNVPAHSELFFNSTRMTVARWPNEEFTRIGESLDTAAPDDGHGRRLGRITEGFSYQGDRPSHWKPDPNIWVHGYWAWDWADTYERIASLDPATRAIKTAPPYGLYGFRKDQRYYFLNVLEELDSPGEYYLDSAAGLVYFWPPSDPNKAEVFLSQLAGPVFHIANARQLTLQGLAIEATRGPAIRIEGGTAVRIVNAAITNIGTTGVLIDGGTGHSVERSRIAYTGDSAIELSGGDRKTLTPAGHRVEDCEIHHMGQWVRTYNPAVKINGVGNRAAHNHIHDAPHAGILLTGNDHVIEFNNIHHLAMETGDVGAIYIGRDYTERGTVIRNNYIHELGGVGLGSMAVYLDDCASGITVTGNLFYKVKYGAFIGGGRDNIVEDNVFISASPAVHVDARCIDPKPVWHNMTYQMMKPKVLAPGPFLDRYPALRAVLPYLEKTTGVPPEGNVIRRNRIYGDGLAIREPARPFVTDVGENKTLESTAGFDPATGAFPAFPYRQIGPRPVQ